MKAQLILNEDPEEFIEMLNEYLFHLGESAKIVGIEYSSRSIFADFDRLSREYSALVLYIE